MWRENPYNLYYYNKSDPIYPVYMFLDENPDIKEKVDDIVNEFKREWQNISRDYDEKDICYHIAKGVVHYLWSGGDLERIPCDMIFGHCARELRSNIHASSPLSG